MNNFYRYSTKHTDSYKHTDLKGLKNIIVGKLKSIINSSDRLGSDEIDELIDIVRIVNEIKVVRR